MRLEPDWWPRARTLSDRGHTAKQIAKMLGKSKSAVLYCLNPKVRKTAIEGSKRRWAAHAEAGGTTAGQIRNLHRQKLRSAAREEFLANGGGSVSELRKYYRKLNCL
jgi:predicted transcriptional regulator